MGHASKQMEYEVYGNYVEGLEEDVEAIYHYFGPGLHHTPEKGKPDTVQIQYRAQFGDQFF